MTINFEQFEKEYSLVKNHLITDGPYNGCMFETFGKEVDYIVSLANNPKSKQNVWTLLECDNEEQYIVPGYSLINRLGYFISKKSWALEEEFILEVNDNEMCTIEEAIDYCISFGETQFKIGLDKYNVDTYFNENLDPTFDGEMTIGRAKYTAIGYYEDRLEIESTEFDDEIHDYYSQVK